MSKVEIVIFAQYRELAKKIIEKINKNKNKICIRAVISDNNFYKNIKKENGHDFLWKSNRFKNEQKFINKLKKNSNLIGFSLQHKWIIKKSTIEIFKGNLFNFHFGKLPDYRGHNPVIHAMLKDEKYIYGTIHQISEKLDRGKIASEVRVLNTDKTSYEIENELCKLFSKEFVRLINIFKKKKKIRLKKIKKGGNFNSFKDIEYLKKINNIYEIRKKTLAFDYPGHKPAYLKSNGNKKYLRKADVL